MRTFKLRCILENPGYDRANIEREEAGERVVVGKLNPAFLQTAEYLFTGVQDDKSGKMLIDTKYLSDLSKASGRDYSVKSCVKAFGYSDKKGKIISKAPEGNPAHDFWKYFSVVIPYKGFVLREDDPKDAFIIATALYDSRIYFKGIQDRPPTLVNTLFEAVDITGLSTDVSLRDTSTKGLMDFARVLMKMSKVKLEMVARVADIVGYTSMTQKTLSDEIFSLVERDNQRRVHGGELVMDFVYRINNMDKDMLLATQLVEGARHSLLSKNNSGIYCYEHIELGRDYKEVAEFLVKNPQIGGKIGEALKVKAA